MSGLEFKGLEREVTRAETRETASFTETFSTPGADLSTVVTVISGLSENVRANIEAAAARYDALFNSTPKASPAAGFGSVWGHDNPLGYRRDRPLEDYRISMKTSLIGDPVENITWRAQRGPVSILDTGAGEGNAASALKALFGDGIHLDTNDLHPMCRVAGDRHFQDDFLTAEFDRPYDLIFSMYGPHSYVPDGRVIDSLQKTASHLNPDGEFFGAVVYAAMSSPDGQLLSRLSFDVPLMLRLREAGLVVRVTMGAGGYSIYMKRLAASEPVDLRGFLTADDAVLSEFSAEVSKDAIQSDVENILREKQITVEGSTLDWSDPLGEPGNQDLLSPVAYYFSELGFPQITAHVEPIVSEAFGRFVASTNVKYGLAPTSKEIVGWAGGRNNPLHNTSALTDILLKRILKGWL